VSPNGLRISGAEGVRCMRGLGDLLNMPPPWPRRQPAERNASQEGRGTRSQTDQEARANQQMGEIWSCPAIEHLCHQPRAEQEGQQQREVDRDAASSSYGTAAAEVPFNREAREKRQ